MKPQLKATLLERCPTIGRWLHEVPSHNVQAIGDVSCFEEGYRYLEFQPVVDSDIDIDRNQCFI
jgi:hypothetical protein